VRAVVLEEYGPAENLEPKEVADPEPQAGEVLVRVKAAGLNRIDIWVRSGVYKTDLPRILGLDISGVVEETAGGVTSVSAGDAVVVNPDISCGECRFCIQGWESLCERMRMLGVQLDGGYAELTRVPARNVHRMPEGISFEEAAALPVNYFTSWHALMTRTQVKPGQYLLVVGAGSGVGTAAIQMGKLAGATVISTVGEEWKEEKAKELGSDFVVNRRKQDIVEAVMTITEGKGVDVVFEHAGQAAWEAALRCLRPGGSMVFLGATTGDTVQLNIRGIYRRQLNLLGCYGWNRSEVAPVLSLAAEGRLKPVIDSVFPLSEASKAHVKMEKDQHFGKMVLRP